MSYPSNDTEWYEAVVTAVEKDHFTTENGGLGYKPAAAGQPRVGSVCRYYGKKWGPVRGLFFDGVENFYRDAEEDREWHARRRVARDLERQNLWETKTRAEYERDFATLPPVFKKRLKRFEYNLEGFGWKHGCYEMSSCVDAVKIAEALKTAEEIERFAKLSWSDQDAAVPDLFPGHSGNTLGMAIRLAHHYVTDPELVWMEHAAMAALLGCVEAGCPPVAR